VADSTGGGIYQYYGTLTVTNSIVALNEAPSDSNIYGSIAKDSGFNLIGVEPAFVRNPGPGADTVWGTEDDEPGDLRLTDRSPAINAGNNNSLPEGLAVDLDGKPRIFGQRTDIGAYEYQADPAPNREQPSTIVTTAVDTFDLYDGLVSVREAVLYSTSAGSIVTFDRSLDGQEIVLAGTAICLDHPVTIDASDLTSLTINGNGRSGVFVVYGADVTLNGLTITGGTAGRGGGIANYGGLTVAHSTISGNSVGHDGGGIYNAHGELTVTDSTISGNSTEYDGGGIYNDGTLTITNSTVSDNSASRRYGGGIYSDFLDTLTATTSTISGNLAWRGGGIYFSSGTLVGDNTIVAGNSALKAGPDVLGEFAGTSSYNLIGDGSGMSGIADGVNGNLVGTAANPIDPRLGQLGDYGGPTWTMPLLADSPAIDAGDPEIVDPPATDQRGFVRIFDGDKDGVARIDIGAFELSMGVLGRHVFYHNSAFDGDDAIATDKVALRPGDMASVANYTNYDKGINGIIVDIVGLGDPVGLTAADFLFKVGNDSDPSGWLPGPSPSAIDVRPGEGIDGSDRVAIVWSDHAIEKQWLQVTVGATDNTGLLEEDVFYFGNAPGEAGDTPFHTIVNATDESVARNSQHSAVDPASIDDLCDYNRDGLVNATDQIIARNNQTDLQTMLRLITVPVAELLVEPEPVIPGDSAAEVDWLYQFEQITAMSDWARRSSVEEAVDRLLAAELI